MSRLPRTRILSLIACVATLAVGSLVSVEPAAAAPGRVIAEERLIAAQGGEVRAPNGASLIVPARVMSRNGKARIVALGKGRYDFHISVPWRGVVGVSLPLKGRSDAILHRVGGAWFPEGPRGERIVWVDRLSWFSTLKNKAVKALCLSWNARKIVSCLVQKGIVAVNKEIGLWIARQISESCAAAVIAAGFTGGPLSAFTTVINEPPCVPVVSAPGVPQAPPAPAPAPPTSPAPPTQPVPPIPAPPAPPPPAPTAARGFVIGDAFLGGTWARTDPNNGTWHSRSNPPANGAYWYPNNLGVAVDCARSAASYTVKFVGGGTQTWTTWFHVTDGKWYPSAASNGINTDGQHGLPSC